MTFAASALLEGCWHAPTADIQPAGPPRLIEAAIAVQSNWSPVVVQAIGADRSNLELLARGESRPVWSAALLHGKDLQRVQVGDTLQAILRRELTVFVSNDRSLHLPRVLAADPSYRVLTLEFADGRREVFKVNRGVRLGQIEPGDDVAFRTVGVIELRPSSR